MAFTFEKDEQLIRVVRRHWLVLLWRLLPIVFLALFVELIKTVLALLPTTLSSFTLAIPAELLSAAILLFYLFLWMAAFFVFTDFYLDVWYITSKRIVSVEQIGFFYRDIKSFRVERIQDTQTVVFGFIHTIFGIGDVHVETAGEEHEIVMETVAQPRKVREIIMQVAKTHQDV